MALPATPYNPGAPSRQVDPPSFAAAITPNDDDDLTEVPRFVSFTKSTDVLANIAVIMEGQITPVVLTLQCGVQHKLRVRRVMSTDTTATVVIGYW